MPVPFLPQTRAAHADPHPPAQGPPWHYLSSDGLSSADEARLDELYDALYCQRGEAENRIKEVQLDLFGTRASCHKFLANQFRLLLAGLAYTLMHRLRAPPAAVR
jgi:hypothetical protein